MDVEILGKWWDNELDVGRMLFKTEDGRYFHTLFDKSGEMGKHTPLLLKKLNSELRYYFDESNVNDEYFILTKDSIFNLFDRHGSIDRFKSLE